MPDSQQAHLTPPKQDRSRRTLERIVRASLELLDEEGPSGLTVQAIVRRADSSVGSFYARFGGKDDLLEYLGDRVWREATERWDAALASRDWSELDFPTLARGAVALLSEAQRSRSSYLRALDRAAGGSEDAYASFRSHLLHGIRELLVARPGEIDHDDPGLAVDVGLRAVMGVIDAEATGPDGPTPEVLVDEAVEVLLAYLTGAGGRRWTDGDVEFFDIWG